MNGSLETPNKKNTELNWQSTSQFPFLIGLNTANESPTKNQGNKFKKP